MANPHAISKYADIWTALKADGQVTLAIPIPLHKKVLRGLRDLKDKDVMFKFESDAKRQWHKLEIISDQARVRIFLIAYPMLKNLTVADL